MLQNDVFSGLIQEDINVQADIRPVLYVSTGYVQNPVLHKQNYEHLVTATNICIMSSFRFKIQLLFLPEAHFTKIISE